MPRQQQSFCLLVIQVATLPASKLHALIFSLLPADWSNKANGGFAVKRLLTKSIDEQNMEHKGGKVEKGAVRVNLGIRLQ